MGNTIIFYFKFENAMFKGSLKKYNTNRAFSYRPYFQNDFKNNVEYTHSLKENRNKNSMNLNSNWKRTIFV